ncbi:electron transfer flavoprotein subunit alpha/FixB family protein [Marinivivus vitaminiproducens]|uniref:electron transfer flavoprotein subunit alpha/FixB family protein n=1 Tax=Marinivivus vitaminiproducens TaxID=3035935 RepID=UPI0027A00BB1|nr:FAD-binding protein [Geminicoccaceae bacterium SCSIO 64248]
MAALVLAEHDGKTLSVGTRIAITAAKQVDPDLHVLVPGKDARPVAEDAARVDGVGRVLLVEHDAYAEPLAEDVAALMVATAEGYGALIAASSTYGKNIMPRVAALLDVAQLSDIVAVEAPDTYKRYIYAGNALATVKTNDAVKVITVRVTAFEAAADGGAEAPIDTVAAVDPSGLARFVDRAVSNDARPDLASARVVVSGGRGLQSGENFKMLEELADLLHGAVGASRAAVDAGFMPNEYQVGQTGKIVAPDLYIAIGISGAIQHLAGMKDSKVIVAINKDEDAPIFQVADYGLVGDLFTVVPELTASLKQAH